MCGGIWKFIGGGMRGGISGMGAVIAAAMEYHYTLLTRPKQLSTVTHTNTLYIQNTVTLKEKASSAMLLQHTHWRNLRHKSRWHSRNHLWLRLNRWGISKQLMRSIHLCQRVLLCQHTLYNIGSGEFTIHPYLSTACTEHLAHTVHS